MLWKINDLLVYTTPNQLPPKMDILPKNFLAAKWLVWHSMLLPNQQRQPLPSLLSDSYSMLSNIFFWFIDVFGPLPATRGTT